MKYLRKNIKIVWVIVVSIAIGVFISPIYAQYGGDNNPDTNIGRCGIAENMAKASLMVIHDRRGMSTDKLDRQLIAFSTYYSAFCR
jgi:hypothetical protein